MPRDQVLNPTLMRLAEIEARLTRLETRHMSDTFGLSDAVLERAAEAIEDHEDTGYDPEQIVDLFVRPALPVLVPAIREALVREALADYKSAVETYGEEDAINPETWIRSFLPADEGSAS